MSEKQVERRKARRRPAHGDIRIWLEDGSEAISGRLLDLSEAGFRAAHQCHALAAGQEVRFERPGAFGRACAVWNRIAAGSVETGFLILESAAGAKPA